jgi:hypothetical protein
VKVVKECIEQIEVMDRTYFKKDRLKKIKAKMDECLALLDSRPIDLGK